MTSSHQAELRERIEALRKAYYNNVSPDDGTRYDQYGSVSAENFTNAIMALIIETEKAYGGCRLCFGKGYATVNGRWAGTDEWTFKRVTGGKAIEMKFCTCDRGKQLETLLEVVL